ncbi:MAG: ABC transporter permease [Clostridiales Family XIII bacterium]|jgi:D-methionine transport system permease protein|nr:ABC transporter permease [Clostridiales Family XIII bacterium]
MGSIFDLLPQIGKALGETFYMMIFTLAIAAILGIPLGTLLYMIRPGSILQKPRPYLVLDTVVNIVRSFPFLVLMVAIIPLTKMIVGTSLGTTAVIVPLTISAIPDFARLTEQVLLEIDRGVIEMAEAMGANMFQVIWKVMYREARAGMVNAATIISVSFLSYSTVAGLVGGGGIGDFAIRYGYYRYQPDVMIFTVVLIILIVQAIQTTGRIISRKLDMRY